MEQTKIGEADEQATQIERSPEAKESNKLKGKSMLLTKNKKRRKKKNF